MPGAKGVGRNRSERKKTHNEPSPQQSGGERGGVKSVTNLTPEDWHANIGGVKQEERFRRNFKKKKRKGRTLANLEMEKRKKKSETSGPEREKN